jgi:hypothetical protein
LYPLQVLEKFIYTLKKRESDLLSRLEAIHAVKFQTLEEQQQQLRYTNQSKQNKFRLHSRGD